VLILEWAILQKLVKKINKFNLFAVAFYLISPFIFYFNFIFSNGFWAAGDGIDSYMPSRKFLVESIQHFRIPLWNEYINSGAPFLEDIQSAVFYIPNLLLYSVLPFELAFNYILLLHFSLAGIFTYFYLLQRFDKRAAFLGGLAFMFCAALNARRGHVTIENAIVWLPLILYFYEKLLLTRKKKFVIMMSMAFATQIFAGFIQISFYTGIALLIYFIFSLRRYPTLKQWLSDKVNFAIFTIGFAALQLIPTYMLGKYVGRDSIPFEVFASYSLSFRHLITLIFPFYYGSDAPSSLFNIPNLSDQGVIEFMFYAGILPLFFFLYVVYRYWRSDSFVKLWSTVAIVSLILALGNSIPPIEHIMYRIPLYNMFRVSARFLFVFDLSVAVLFAKLFHEMLLGNINLQDLKAKIRLWSVSIVVLTFGMLYGIQNLVKYIIKADPTNANIALLLKNYTLSNPAIYLPIIIIIVSNVILFLTNKMKMNSKVIFILFVCFVFVDLQLLGYNYSNNFNNPKISNLPQELNKIIAPEERIWPIFNSDDYYLGGLTPNRNIYFDISTINGYVTFQPENFKKILNFNERGVNLNWLDLLANNQIISSLNTKYIVVNENLSNKIESINQINNSKTESLLELKNINLNLTEQPYVLHEEKINIKPNSIYKIRVKLNRPINVYKGNVSLDFYGGPEYDKGDQKLFMLNGDTLEGYITTGDKVPDNNVAFRIISTSSEPIIVQTCQLMRLIPDTQSRPLYKEILSNNNHKIYENLNVLPRFYSVNQIKDIAEEPFSIYNNDLSQTAVLEDYRGKLEVSKSEIERIAYNSGYAKIKNINNNGGSFIVFSETYFPGWKAFIDGKQVSIYKVNGLTQGVYVDKGEHIIEFKYFPSSLIIGFIIFIVTLLYSVLYLFFPRKLILK
jgi:hypothetical protein